VVHTQAAAALRENGSAVSSGQTFDRIDATSAAATSAAFRDDSLENEKVAFTRRTAAHSSPRFGGYIVGVTASREVESAFEPSL
jgi:hypothetical protein